MLKRSHREISRFLARQMQKDEINRHLRTLCMGSVEPDVNPKLRIHNHEFGRTWEATKKRIRTIEETTVTDNRGERAVCRQIGIVLHYLADYFTCPHNPSYHYILLLHAIYEDRQAFRFEFYRRSPKMTEQYVTQKEYVAAKIHNAEDLISHIEEMHARYLEDKKHTPKGDCAWVTEVCTCAALFMVPKVFGEIEEVTTCCPEKNLDSPGH